jgi:hypothetical protein
MKLENILELYPIEVLEQLASNKITDISHIRLPKSVLIDELCGIINKPSYIEKTISFRNPPGFQILDTLLNQENLKVHVKGFKERILKYTEELIEEAKNADWIRTDKNISLYLKMVKTAWESDSRIDASEINLLNFLRNELNISFKQHTILIHHEDLIQFWYSDNYYEKERNYLISSGIVFPFEDYYVIPESIGKFIRQSWGMELNREQYTRMLSYLTNIDLSEILSKTNLQTSGASQQKIQRIIDNFISPRKSLSIVNLSSLRDIARESGSTISGTKEDVIDNLIDYFDDDNDLKYIQNNNIVLEPIEPEKKALSKENFIKLLNLLSNEQLYNVACCLNKIKKSGNKDAKILNLWESIYSEETILNQLTNTELYELCEKNYLKLSGPKNDKIKRLIDAANNILDEEKQKEKTPENPLEIIAESTKDQIFSEQAKIEHYQTFENLIPRDEFPFLNGEELMVLSWVKDLKSINEYELDRLISRYNLPWYFPRTQMEQLNEKLLKNDKDILIIRHVGEYSIYEFKY